jgi:hypothetical protein
MIECASLCGALPAHPAHARWEGTMAASVFSVRGVTGRAMSVQGQA